MNEIAGGFAAKLEKQCWWNEATFHDMDDAFPDRQCDEGNRYDVIYILHYHARQISECKKTRTAAVREASEGNDNEKSTKGEKASLTISWVDISNLAHGVQKLVYEFHLTPYTHWHIAPSPKMPIAPSITLRNGIPFSYHKFWLRSWVFRIDAHKRPSVITNGKLGEGSQT